MIAHACKAWLGMADAFTARICAWCPDKAEADAWAVARGLYISHGMCEGCCAAELGSVAGSVPAPVRAQQVAHDVTGETFPDFQRGPDAGVAPAIGGDNSRRRKTGDCPAEPFTGRADSTSARPALNPTFDTGSARASSEHRGAAPGETSLAAVSTPTGVPARVVYVSMDLIAAAAGISAYKLHNQFAPAHWAVPRDWKMGRNGMLVNLAAVPELGDALAAAGEHAAEHGVRTWWVRYVQDDSDSSLQPNAALPLPWYMRGQYQ